jgi:integrase
MTFSSSTLASSCSPFDRAERPTDHVACRAHGRVHRQQEQFPRQARLGRKVGIPYGGRPRTCPVRAVHDWIDLSYLTEGPLFRPINRFGKILPSRLTGQSVALIVKRWALEAGFDPALFAGHSLRSGLATAAAKAGKSERSIMKQTGHRSVTVVRRYIRDAELFDDNAAAGIGL